MKLSHWLSCSVPNRQLLLWQPAEKMRICLDGASAQGRGKNWLPMVHPGAVTTIAATGNVDSKNPGSTEI